MRKILILSSALSVFAAGTAFAQGVHIQPRVDQNQFPVQQSQEVDPLSTSGVPRGAAPARLQSKVFVHPNTDQNQSPASGRIEGSLF